MGAGGGRREGPAQRPAALAPEVEAAVKIGAGGCCPGAGGSADPPSEDGARFSRSGQGDRASLGPSSQLSDVMRGFIYDTKSIMFDQHLVLSALSNVGIFISICDQLKKVTNKR